MSRSKPDSQTDRQTDRQSAGRLQFLADEAAAALIGKAGDSLAQFCTDNQLALSQLLASQSAVEAGAAPPPLPTTWSEPYGGADDRASEGHAKAMRKTRRRPREGGGARREGPQGRERGEGVRREAQAEGTRRASTPAATRSSSS